MKYIVCLYFALYFEFCYVVNGNFIFSSAILCIALCATFGNTLTESESRECFDHFAPDCG